MAETGALAEGGTVMAETGALAEGGTVMAETGALAEGAVIAVTGDRIEDLFVEFSLFSVSDSVSTDFFDFGLGS